MKRINLLEGCSTHGRPWSFYSDRQRLFSLAAWTAVLIWAGSAALHVWSLGTEVSRRQANLPTLRADADRQEALHAERSRLAEQGDWLSQLGSKGPAEAVMVAVAAATREDTALSHFSLTPTNHKPSSGASTVPPPAPDAYVLRLGGVTTDDTTQADFVRSLGNVPFLNDVRLLESGVADPTRPLGRRFVVTASVDRLSILSASGHVP